MTTPDQNEFLLGALNRAVEVTVDYGRSLLDVAWEPAAGSEGDLELSEATAADWNAQEVRTAYAAARLLTHGVLENLSGLRPLLVDPMPTLTGPIILARSAIETSSMVWWLLEPGVGARRRIARQLTLILRSARSDAQIASSYAGGTAAAALAYEQAVRQRIAALGFSLRDLPGKPWDVAVEGEKPATATEAIARMLHPAMSTSQRPDWVYRVHSAIAHGQVHGLMTLLHSVDPNDKDSLMRWGLDGRVLDQTVQLAVRSFGVAIERVIKVLGWPKSEYDRWYASVAEPFGSIRWASS